MTRPKLWTKPVVLAAAAAAALGLAGCAGGETDRTAPQPKLPHAVAAELAARSDAVADALGAGDSCGAATLAAQLQQETISAINSGRVAGALQEPLSATVNDLVTRVKCIPPPPPQDEHGRGKHKGNKKKHGEGD